MSQNYTQSDMFPELQAEITTKTFQIKCVEDPEFVVNILVKENEDPTEVALERLGYFLLPEGEQLYV